MNHTNRLILIFCVLLGVFSGATLRAQTTIHPAAGAPTPTKHNKEANEIKNKILVVMSGGHLLDLKESKVYYTGYYLNELYVPVAALVEAGYTPVYANPNGDTPSMDASSNDDKFFGGDTKRRMEALRFINEQAGLRHPTKLSQVIGHTQEYAGVFVPGGHAPMIDLVKDTNLGAILKSFHDNARPTALICHGPMALLSAMPQTEKYNEAMVAGNSTVLQGLVHGWLYAGYKMTVFSKREEQQIELPQLNGYIQAYNDEALASAGAEIVNAEPWKANVIEDRELITGQQPFSDHRFADALLAKLKAKTH